MTVDESTVRWSREEVQRVLYRVVKSYQQAATPAYVLVTKGQRKPKLAPRRFILFGRRFPALGGDSELLRDAIRIAIGTLKDNNWWPEGQGDSGA